VIPTHARDPPCHSTARAARLPFACVSHAWARATVGVAFIMYVCGSIACVFGIRGFGFVCVVVLVPGVVLNLIRSPRGSGRYNRARPSGLALLLARRCFAPVCFSDFSPPPPHTACLNPPAGAVHSGGCLVRVHESGEVLWPRCPTDSDTDCMRGRARLEHSTAVCRVRCVRRSARAPCHGLTQLSINQSSDAPSACFVSFRYSPFVSLRRVV